MVGNSTNELKGFYASDSLLKCMVQYSQRDQNRAATATNRRVYDAHVIERKNSLSLLHAATSEENLFLIARGGTA